jgi:hypothetical protein
MNPEAQTIAAAIEIPSESFWPLRWTGSSAPSELRRVFLHLPKVPLRSTLGLSSNAPSALRSTFERDEELTGGIPEQAVSGPEHGSGDEH